MPKYDEENRMPVVVRGIVKHESNKILLTRCVNKSGSHLKKWELPGGKITQEKCLEKDLSVILQKGLGIVVKVDAGICFCQKRATTRVSTYKGFSYLEIAIPCTFVGGDISISNDDAKNVWVDYSSIFSYDLTEESKEAISQFLLTRVEDDPLKLPVILAARALIKDRLGKYLFLRRSGDKEFSGKWDLPGGKLSSLEVLPELLKREVFEETGLVVDVIAPSLYVHSQIGKVGRHRGYTYINILNDTKLRSGKIKLSKEHDKYGWFSVDEFFKLKLADYLPLPLTEIFLKVA